MQLAQVVGRATATDKHPTLAGWRLLLAQPLDNKGGPDGSPQLVVDQLGARSGDQIMITSDGKAVRKMMESNNTPVRWAVLGIIDDLS